ncbi:uncharacterized protein SCDLUD_003162 [Saccharomycodes ludwigii]|uniref:uncharacterized protein n=1 Tax=Saccharomycodes ludwigii TaxID=36035 RepID=UPI001E84AD8D|nr:hypothetical protein SCDLUD_003162 [Saccharomycodes ludwigii]KAH3900191.1 hypothetical protein SCDLUD_003162 [Saccharomycodes ludwigii]
MLRLRSTFNYISTITIKVKRLSYRNIHTSSSPIAFAFDIDGVLVRSRNPIPNASKTLNYLTKENVPFILLTNGGGYTETQRVEQINSILNTKLHPNQIVLSHTPFKSISSDYEKILAVGPPVSTKQVAREYGFKEVYEVGDIVEYNRNIAPFSALSNKVFNPTLKRYYTDNNADTLLDLTTKPFDGIFVFSDPRDWGADVQIVLDLLNSEKGILNTKRNYKSDKPSIPIFFSQKDFLWANNYTLNRFGLGAYREIIHRLYTLMNNNAVLKDTVMGKPTSISYEYAMHVLNRLHRVKHNGKSHPEDCDNFEINPQTVSNNTMAKNNVFSKVYMVGDNPASDIIGAYNYGWSSCLVRTGVYKDGDPLPCQPTMIVDDVWQAVQQALRKEGK